MTKGQGAIVLPFHIWVWRVTVDIIIEDERWTALGLEPLATRAVDAALSHLGCTGEVAILAADDARIAALNTEFRGKPTPTNVLSWPSEDRAPPSPGERPIAPEIDELGDIALAYDTCAREAEAGKIPLSDHVTHLVIHGTLHLLGYDHEQDADADLMEATEIAILAGLGVADPYDRSGV